MEYCILYIRVSRVLSFNLCQLKIIPKVGSYFMIMLFYYSCFDYGIITFTTSIIIFYHSRHCYSFNFILY